MGGDFCNNKSTKIAIESRCEETMCGRSFSDICFLIAQASRKPTRLKASCAYSHGYSAASKQA